MSCRCGCSMWWVVCGGGLHVDVPIYGRCEISKPGYLGLMILG